MKNGLYAKFITTKGDIIANLKYEITPGTVGNFVGLAEGEIQNSFKEQGIPFYNGIKFHRVIKDFMIQAGCPQGKGTGGPGYQFDDEISEKLNINQKTVNTYITRVMKKLEVDSKTDLYLLASKHIKQPY